MALSEFDLITRFFSAAPDHHSGVQVGIGDDAAVVRVPAGHELVMALDTLVAGVHFPDDAPAHAVGHKALAVNLSDMAAMGAAPNWLLLGLTLPQVDEAWVEEFSRGLKGLADQHRVALIGGDTTRGPLTVTVQINGLVPSGTALRRSGARPGDRVYVSGQLGDAGLGLMLALQQQDMGLSRHRRDYFLQRLHTPTPRLALGQALRGLASAAIDISDGLLADLDHILAASTVGAELDLDRLPLADEVRAMPETGWQLALCAGDDYELCFTLPPDRVALLEARLESLDCPCTCIGEIVSGAGLRLWQGGSEIQAPQRQGYRHFD